MTDKTIRNLDSGASVSVWKDGEWYILHCKGGGAETTLSLPDHTAFDIAYGLTPELGEWHKRYCDARDALYNLTYPEIDPIMLRHCAVEADCGDCDYLGHACPKERDGECGFQMSEGFRKLADAFELREKVRAEIAKVPEITALDTLWENVNAQGGVATNEIEEATNAQIGKVLEMIEALGGNDPAPKRYAAAEAEIKF